MAVPGPAANQEEVRRHNLSRVLRQVHLSGPVTRAELTARTGLNRSTIAGLVSSLVAAGLATEQVPAGRGGAGRPSLLVVPRSRRVWVIAAEVRVEALAVARVGLGGQVLDRRELERSLRRSDPRQVAATLASLTAELCRDAPGEALLAGWAVAVPGVIRTGDGHVHVAPNLGWVDVAFGRMVAEALPATMPVTVGNDADLGALAELTRGVARGRRDVVYLSGDVGIGAGVIVDGRPLSGAAGYGGEVGHMKVRPDGSACRCGARGCWETEAGEEAFLARAGRAPQGGVTAVREVLAAAAAGEQQARDALEEVGRWLGLGIANLVNIFNPEMVVIGGVTGLLLPALGDVLAAHLAENAMSPAASQVTLAVPATDRDATLLGAAELAFEELLADPLGVTARRATGRR